MSTMIDLNDRRPTPKFHVSYIFQLSLLERMCGIPIFSTTKSHFASALLSVIPSGGSGYQGDEKEI